MREHAARFACFGGACTVHVAGDGPAGTAPDAVAAARRRLLGWHDRLTRFDPRSELSILNADPRAHVVGEAEQEERPAGHDAGGQPPALVAAREGDRDVGQAGLQVAVAEQRESVDREGEQRREGERLVDDAQIAAAAPHHPAAHEQPGADRRAGGEQGDDARGAAGDPEDVAVGGRGGEAHDCPVVTGASVSPEEGVVHCEDSSIVLAEAAVACVAAVVAADSAPIEPVAAIRPQASAKAPTAAPATRRRMVVTRRARSARARRPASVRSEAMDARLPGAHAHELKRA